MENIKTLYYERFIHHVVESYSPKLKAAKPGHCMKITGLAMKELRVLLPLLRPLNGNMEVFILQETEKGDDIIHATKLIELRNNPDKFPSGYVIELTNSEKEHVVKNFDHLETLKFSHATVKGFTEQGLYMLATILKSPMATATAIAIIDTFTQLRKLARTIDKVNEDAKEHGILPDKATEGKIQAAMNEVFADKLPLKMRKLTFGVNLGVLKFSIETTRESKE